MEKIIQILETLHPEIDFRSENQLIDKGILDSLRYYLSGWRN